MTDSCACTRTSQSKHGKLPTILFSGRHIFPMQSCAPSLFQSHTWITISPGDRINSTSSSNSKESLYSASNTFLTICTHRKHCQCSSGHTHLMTRCANVETFDELELEGCVALSTRHILDGLNALHSQCALPCRHTSQSGVSEVQAASPF